MCCVRTPISIQWVLSFISGSDFVSSMGQPSLYGGLRAYKNPASGCMKTEDNHARQVTDTGSINIFLDDDSFRKIVLGDNYFRLTGLDSTYAPPPVCGTDVRKIKIKRIFNRQGELIFDLQ